MFLYNTISELWQPITKHAFYIQKCFISRKRYSKLIKPKLSILKDEPTPIIPKLKKNEPTHTYFEHISEKINTLSTNTQVHTPKYFAVVDIEGKQYKVTVGDVLMVNYLPDTLVGDKLSFDRVSTYIILYSITIYLFLYIMQVLLVGGKDFTVVGQPFVPKTSVYSCVEEHTETKLINIQKFHKRKGYRRLMRYRDKVTILRILNINWEK